MQALTLRTLGASGEDPISCTRIPHDRVSKALLRPRRRHRIVRVTAMTKPLVLIKTVHTVIWGIFAACILAIPFFVFAHRARITLGLISVVMVEVVVIVVNRWRCPLTDVAARYTTDRRDNFDIYLPVWLARYNKNIFGTLFATGLLYALMTFVFRE
jgi:hypothetical protein